MKGRNAGFNRGEVVENVGAKVRELWFGGRRGVAVRRFGPNFWSCGPRKAHGVFGEVLGSELRTVGENMPRRFPPRQPSFGRAHDSF